MPDHAAARWFLPGAAPLAHQRLVLCFPHAGGDPRTFLGLQPGIGDAAQIVPVVMPGRGHRAGETVPASITDLAGEVAEAIAGAAGSPVYLLGHSLGAVIAFEVARWLRRLPALRHLVASGCPAPSLQPTPQVVRAARLRGQAFAEAVAQLGGLPAQVLADTELAGLLLPPLQAEARLLASYHYQPGTPLPIGVTLVNGTSDPQVDEVSLRPWRRECLHPPACHWVAGGHFYFITKPMALASVLRSLLDADRAAAAPGHHVELI
jgi:surfactin synthase thioesterase subunit